MATPANVTASEGVWTSLNTLTSIATGKNMLVQNLTDVPIRVCTAVSQPTDASGYHITDSLEFMVATATAGESHWVFCPSRDALLQASELTT